MRVYALCLITHYNFAAYSLFGSLHYKSMHLGNSNSRVLVVYMSQYYSINFDLWKSKRIAILICSSLSKLSFGAMINHDFGNLDSAFKPKSIKSVYLCHNPMKNFSCNLTAVFGCLAQFVFRLFINCTGAARTASAARIVAQPTVTATNCVVIPRLQFLGKITNLTYKTNKKTRESGWPLNWLVVGKIYLTGWSRLGRDR